MVDDRSEEAIVISHLAHIIRDVFQPTSEDKVICYQKDEKLLTELRKPEHGVEAWGLHHEDFDEKRDKSHYWEIGYNDTFYGKAFCDLFISLDYFTVHPDLTIQTVVTMWKLMKPKGLVLLTNPSLNSDNFQWGCFRPREDLMEELRRYSLFATKSTVLVLENDI